MKIHNNNHSLFVAVVAVTAVIPLCLGFSPLVPSSVVVTRTKTFRPIPTLNDVTMIRRNMVNYDNDDTTTRTTTTTPKTTIRNADGESFSDSFSDSVEAIQEFIRRIDLSALNLDTMRQNTMSGELGTRGEGYFAVQAFLIFCILINGVPIVGDTLTFLLGPGLLLAGAAVIVLGTIDLGDSLSPWPVPSDKTTGLKTSGIYEQLRHPMYAGTLAAAAGFSIVTGSANRLLLTAILWYALEVKAKYEEEALLEKFPKDYPKYQQDVPGKFVPKAILTSLPWNKVPSDE